MKKTIPLLSLLTSSSLLLLSSCDSHSKNDDHGQPHNEDGSHVEATSDDHDDHDHGEEVALGTFEIGGLKVEAAQAHGSVEAGKEFGLIIKLPYNDDGSTIIRAWIGTEDRTLSSPGKGEYAPSHGDYEIHTIAPDPLPEGSQWQIEIEKPDGTKLTGSFPFN